MKGKEMYDKGAIYERGRLGRRLWGGEAPGLVGPSSGLHRARNSSEATRPASTYSTCTNPIFPLVSGLTSWKRGEITKKGW